MYKKEFENKSKKLLELMMHSDKANKGVFLRELIANSSESLDKLYYKSLEAGYTGIKPSDFTIKIQVDEDERTIKISDNGIGMSREELDLKLGSIRNMECVDIAEKYGVSFYSAFLVSKKVVVVSKAYGSSEANTWESEGSSGFTVDTATKETCGTIITLYLKDDTSEENYSKFLDKSYLKNLVEKYSYFIRYPIKMKISGNLKALNSSKSIWLFPKNKVKKEDYEHYYISKFDDYRAPLRTIRIKVEGLKSYTALLFIPNHVPYHFDEEGYKKGLQLYCSGLLVRTVWEDLIPEHFKFIKGLLDTQDIPINLSDKDLCESKKLHSIAKSLEKKIKKELEEFLKHEREEYEEFYELFGSQLKASIRKNPDCKEVVQDLLLFRSLRFNKYVTLNEYVSRMNNDTAFIYYSMDASSQIPGREILYLENEDDVLTLKAMKEYKGKRFESV